MMSGSKGHLISGHVPASAQEGTAGTGPAKDSETGMIPDREKIPIRVLILPKFEVGEMAGDFPGEAQYYYANALLMTQTYNCPDPFALSEMEDAAVAMAVSRMGLLDHFLIIRDSVNMDVFMLGATPESLWDPDFQAMTLASEDNVEAADIFETAMKNNFAVGSVIIDAVLSGELEMTE